jgi:hypothetical protein
MPQRGLLIHPQRPPGGFLADRVNHSGVSTVYNKVRTRIARL